MILSRLYLENFKQFREPLELMPPEGAIGVIGANGSGKTTLFEAILWTFFGSRGGGGRFANESVPWSGGSAADRSLVEVTLDVGGSSYKVSRSLKRGKVETKVYGSAEEEITSGSSEVAAWVRENLLGMDRTAFEATFFARQKELEFFAGISGVERQREVARILGIDQVETAQKLLRSDRNALRGEAAALERLLEDTDHEALANDLKENRIRRESLAEEAEKLNGELEARSENLAGARKESERLEELYRRHNALGRDLGAANSAKERASGRASDLSRKLEELAGDERTVSKLKPRTEGLGEVLSGIERQEEARRRGERLEAASWERRRRRMEAHNALMAACDLLEELDGKDAAPLEGWAEVFDLEDEEQVRRGDAALAEAGAAHLRAERRLEKLKDIVARYRELSEVEGELRESREELEAAGAEVGRLEDSMRTLSGKESLEERTLRLKEREESVRRELARQRGRAEAEVAEAEKLAKARYMIESSDELAECPTCRRGFEEDEHAEVIGSLSRQEEALKAHAARSDAECERLESEMAKLSGESEEISAVRERMYSLREERAAAISARKQAETEVRRLAQRTATIREKLADDEPPPDELLSEAGREVEALRDFRDARPRLAGLISTYERAQEGAGEHDREVEALSGGPAYEPEVHKELQERRTEIERLRGQVETLEGRLRERPAVEESLKEARGEEERASREVSRLEGELSGLGFDEEEHLKARTTAVEAERLRDEAREKRDDTGRDLGRLEHEISGLQKELARFESQRRISDEKSLEAASLGEMDSLMSRFYRELTGRVRPRLQGEASALVRTLTDGRYERMEFDDNYGVKLFDGLSDAYDISRFSGGEADIVSLCARVALSKMVSDRGGSGSLGFIVLDEVFGALDADRRRNVLLALDRLKRTFGQIFIISHVADVRESALLDELWFIEEDEEGKSAVRRLRPQSSGEAELLEAVER